MAVLAFLAVSDTRHARASLASMFWENASPEVARANLRSVLSTLQSRVPGVLQVTRETVSFDPTADVVVDVAQFLAASTAAADANASAGDRIDVCRCALDLHRGELLAGFEHLDIIELTDWIDTERRSLERRAVGTASLLVDLLLGEARHDEAVQASARLVALDRYREASYLVSMRALLAVGESQQALHEFARCRALLVDELGLTLGAEITALERAIREESPSAASTRPVLSRLDGLPTRRALFGRDDLIEQIARMDREPTGGLVTLCGPSGVGKTSLATAVAHRWRDEGRDVVFVDAVNADDAQQLVQAFSNALAGPLRPHDDDDALAGVADVLGNRAVSVVLDNIEQVDGAPEVISALLGRCPDLLLLATSRRPTRIISEEVLVIPPLEAPTDDQISQDQPGDDSVLGALKRLACVQLFQHRCVIGGSQPAASAVELRAVGRICQLLDGLPLAIELIAGRRQIMGVVDIEDSLRTGLQAGDLSLVDGGFRDAPQRHRGLRAALTSTVDLLDPEAQLVLANISVFDGPFTLDAVRAVCVDDELGHGGGTQGVQALVDFQLLRREERHGTVWFRMLSSVRALATSLLAESGGTDRVHAHRVVHDRDLVERRAEWCFSSANTDWFRYLDEYMPTLRSTLDELHDRNDPGELALVTSLAPYWLDRGRVAEAHGRLSAAQASAPDRARPWLPALCRLWCAGMRAEAIGYGTAADTLADVIDALADLRAVGPPPIVELGALSFVAHVHVIDHTAPLSAASALVEAGVELANVAVHPWFRADFLYTRAVLQHLAGDDERAAAQFAEALDEAELHGNRRVSLYAQMMLGFLGAADPAASAGATLAELLDLAIDIGDHRQTSWLTMSLGHLSALDGDLAVASAHFLDALSLSRDADYFIGIGCCLMGGAGIAVLRDDLAEAVRFHACVEPDLESLGRSMPQGHLEVYLQITGQLRSQADADPTLGAAWSYGATESRSTVLSRLVRYLTHVRSTSL